MGCDLKNRKCECEWYRAKIGHYIDKYRVVKQLGEGNNSKVYLCKDRSRDRKTTFVAVKVLKPIKHEYDWDHDRKKDEYRKEQDIMIKIARHKEQPGLYHDGLMHLMSADVVLRSQNGRPRAFVIESLTMSLHDLVSKMNHKTKKKLAPNLDPLSLPPDTIKRITKGMLLGLEFLHDRIEVVYVGMKPRNLILRLPNMENIIRRELWLNSCADAKADTKREASKRGIPTGMSYFDSDATLKYLLDHVEVVLTDYGRSEWDFRNTGEIVAPDFMRPPEALKDSYVLHKSFDVWNIGVCVRYMIDASYNSSPGWTSFYMLSLWREVGPISAEFILNHGRRDKVFDRFIDKDNFELREGKAWGIAEYNAAARARLNGDQRCDKDDVLPHPVPVIRDFDDLVKDMGLPGEGLSEDISWFFPEEQVMSWVTFLKRCWTLCHHNRPTAKMLLNHPFLFGVSSLAPKCPRPKVRSNAATPGHPKVGKQSQNTALSICPIPPATVRAMSPDAEEVEDLEPHLNVGKRRRSKSVSSELSLLAPEVSDKVARKKRAMTVTGPLPSNTLSFPVSWPQYKAQDADALLTSIKQKLAGRIGTACLPDVGLC